MVFLPLKGNKNMCLERAYSKETALLSVWRSEHFKAVSGLTFCPGLDGHGCITNRPYSKQVERVLRKMKSYNPLSRLEQRLNKLMQTWEMKSSKRLSYKTQQRKIKLYEFIMVPVLDLT